MLLNYNDTLSDLFTLAHEMGHSMHTVLSHENQPFVYAHYTIFVAEVASTLNEALLLDSLLQKTEDAAARVLLLQHEIDSIAATFYTQVLFARFEREAHLLAESGQPITSATLGDLYFSMLGDLYGDSIERDEAYRHTWARIPHFFRSPYYVYQYATCFASAAKLMEGIRSENPAVRRRTLDSYTALLRSGGSNHPMQQLRDAGIDLEQPAAVQSVIDRMDSLVDRLENEMNAISGG
jgi:oligoendopeptidase F